MGVAAEGVETVAQAQALVAMGFASLQGFHFSQPARGERIPVLVSRRWMVDDARTQAEAGSGTARMARSA